MRRLALAVAAALLLCLPASVVTAADVSQEADLGFQQISQCLQSSNDMAVLLVVDESGSLQNTDPQDKRARLLASLVESLGRQAGKPTATGQRRIDLAISTFSGTYRPFTPWTELDKDSSARIAADVKSRIPNLDAGTGGTNHPAALKGIRNQMAEVTGSRPQQPCTVAILFTDGVLEVSDDPAENERAAKDMCRAAGVVDGLRRDDVNLITVMLFDQATAEANADKYRTGRQLLQATAEGSSGALDCGTVPIAAEAARGAYLEGSVDRLATLFSTAFTLSNGTTQVSVPGSPAVFTIDPGIASFTVIGAAPQGLKLAGPNGQFYDIAVDAPGSDPVTAYWDFDTVTATVPVEPAAIGKWTATRPGQTDAVQIFLDTGLGIKLDDVSLIAGQPGEITGRIVRPGRSEPVDLAVYDSAVLTGSMASQSVPLKLEDGGTFTGTVTPEGKGSVAELDLSLALTTVSGQKLVPVSGRFPLPVTLPGEFPQVSPSRLTLTPLVGRNGKATGNLDVVGSQEGPTEVCVGGLQWTSVDDPAIYSTDAPDGCFKLATGERRQLPISVTSSALADERVSGALSLDLTSAEGTTQGIDVPVTFTASRPLNQAVRLGVVILLTLLALLLPVIVLAAFNRHLAKFRAPDGIRGVSVPVVLTKSGIRARQPALSSAPGGLSEEAAFEIPVDTLRVIPLPDKAPRVMTGPDGSTLRTVMPRSIFGSPIAVVAATEGGRVFSNKTPFTQDHGRSAPASFGLGDVWYVTVRDVDLIGKSLDEGVPAVLCAFVPPRGQGDSVHDISGKIRTFAHVEAVTGQLRAAALSDHVQAQGPGTGPVTQTPVGDGRPSAPGTSSTRPTGPGGLAGRPSGPSGRPSGPSGPGAHPSGPGVSPARPSGPSDGDESRPSGPGQPGDRPPGPDTGSGRPSGPA